MSMRTLLQQVRSALTAHQPLTNLVSAQKITFARRPQRDELPGITMSLGNVVYDETKQSEVSAISYRVDVIIYGRSADETTEIHDAVKQAFLNVDSSTFSVRLLDERYFVDADDIHSGYVSARWQTTPGPSQTSPVVLSPAFAGHDKMSIKYFYQLRDDQTTVLKTSEQVYFMNLKATNGTVNHDVRLPLAEENLGKIYTFIFGDNLHSNRTISLLKAENSSEGVNGSQSLVINRALSSCSLVAVRDALSPASYMWRVWAYYGLHD